MRLLTTGPGVAHPTTAVSYASAGSTAAASTAMMKIRPRGLINSGNMCFANSVLQIMLYCPPFHRLFAELGRVLGGVGVSSGGKGNGDGTTAAVVEESAYPLVEATVEFLKEFVGDDRLRDASVNGRVGSGSTSASALVSAPGSSSRTSSSRGKGKERERDDATGGERRNEDDDGGTESFLPTYVYDAMKVKKRFEHMRVSFPLPFDFLRFLPLFPSFLFFSFVKMYYLISCHDAF